jgi:hypothetical protein
VDIAKCGALIALGLGIKGSVDPHVVSSGMMAQIEGVMSRQMGSSEVCMLRLEE